MEKYRLLGTRLASGMSVAKLSQLSFSSIASHSNSGRHGLPDQCDDLPANIVNAAPPQPRDMIEPAVESLIKPCCIDSRIVGNRRLTCRPRTKGRSYLV